MAETWDAVVVGGGHNGLVCGAYLARAGARVCVLERRSLTGGAAVTEEVWPGYKVSTASYIMGLLQPKIILDLELQKHGFEVMDTPPAVFPLASGKIFTAWGSADKFLAEIAKCSMKDAEAYPHYRAHLMGLAPFLKQLMFETPVDPGSKSPRDLARLSGFVWRFRKIGSKFFDIYDLLTLSAYDYLSRWFESDEVKLVLGFFAGGGGGNSSLRTPGSAYMLVRSVVRDQDTPAGPSGFVRGGMGAISDAIRRSGEAHGMVVRTDATVDEILVENHAATGVRLQGGETIRAKIVIANANAKTTFLRLLPAHALPAPFVRQIESFRSQSTVFRINLALDGLPSFPAIQAEGRNAYPAQVTIGDSVDYMDRAHDQARYGRIADKPFLIVKTPSVVDPTLAPTGHHVMNIFGGHAPYELRDGDWDTRREELYETAMNVLRAHAPDIDRHILHRQILTPLDLERIFDLPNGHVHHGEISADQIFFRRPAPHYADYRTPVKRLYQCGASTHPGGGVTGVPGHNAARVILSERRQWS
ncbi:NAD(P)/FAD-dependent oxidoreductase [Mesorhizobium sp. RP14(2022)]|uniref:Pyridine nucleotide-disulfide oxidoreductase domain-containing protein 2 n=1 Tax=Mesorhizobium liriopis TaxID=2953882 RepID=A0ABT1C356_9HYPH|nr:NAD(P)/FAD-dependent oxidoreductase [Mesorhizobium liriopis]MCO6049263.1 NAD(P)/FAD-dependent oxidoreductase [Mesorhizobium liriopis]